MTKTNGANRTLKAASLVLAAALLTVPARAAASDPGPLAPGKPAGVHQAEINEVPYLIITAVLTIVFGMLVLYPSSSSSAASVAPAGTA